MNIYIVVEGEIGEKQVYKNWVSYVNPSLSYCSTINDVTENHYFIAAGGGYPNIFEIINDGLADVHNLTDANGLQLFNRFVVVIDSEDSTKEAKFSEIDDYIKARLQDKPPIDHRVIVQHFCLETWALANKKIVGNNISDPELLKFKRLFNVAINDPELLPALPDEDLNRASFAAKYLRLLLNNKYRNTTYSKNNPKSLLPESYYLEVKSRHLQDGHISSFNEFLTSFV